ncbi:B12 lower ligand biosynthesis radical SAM protein BzaD [Dehalobacterium formicoaceticum]|uniref:B12 lower ligand biosynthesis radical SAM protein BzaD n=1 Tax=Dehalobacterium formicoaceticum TaxID=51515 RepID=A0ABT1Y3W6_9FIRM|nr:B12 lower ligand biosynthesis radical SAM protein BzaD [Dehalobacterium formicoaceticum]MCR6545567.1 B12 lower ligand biosynthesis radical SAM protein BzaD [Dehalobacterium formicoaceticum]
MRILLVQTPSVESVTQERVYPIGIVSLATYLKKAGYDVGLLDMNLEADQFGALKERLLDFQPDLVGLSLRNIDPLANKTSSLIPPFIVTVRLVSALLPKARLVVGGTGFSLFPERIMAELPEIDYGIVGEGEKSYLALLRSLDNPPMIPGLCYRKGEKIERIPAIADFDMREYLVPDRSLLAPELYTGINQYAPSMGIETSRGCPFQCTYCVYGRLQGEKLRCREPRQVVDELEFLYKEHSVQNFHFNAPVVNLPSEHLDEICREILGRRLQITWSGFFREDLLNEENVFLYEAAGCNCFSLSPDGLSQQALDVLGKNMKIEDVIRAGELTAQTDVCTMYHFLVNVPGENSETIKSGMELLDRLYELHAKKRNLGTVVLNNIRIFPGTPIEKIALAQGVISPHTDLIYPVYYNPQPYEMLRYQLETYHLCKNVFMWQEVRLS